MMKYSYVMDNVIEKACEYPFCEPECKDILSVEEDDEILNVPADNLNKILQDKYVFAIWEDIAERPAVTCFVNHNGEKKVFTIHHLYTMAPVHDIIFSLNGEDIEVDSSNTNEYVKNINKFMKGEKVKFTNDIEIDSVK